MVLFAVIQTPFTLSTPSKMLKRNSMASVCVNFHAKRTKISISRRLLTCVVTCKEWVTFVLRFRCPMLMLVLKDSTVQWKDQKFLEKRLIWKRRESSKSSCQSIQPIQRSKSFRNGKLLIKHIEKIQNCSAFIYHLQSFKYSRYTSLEIKQFLNESMTSFVYNT